LLKSQAKYLRDGQSGRQPDTWPQWYRYWVADPLVGTFEYCIYYILQLLPIDLCSAIGARLGRYSRKEQHLLTQRARGSLRQIFPRMSRRDDENFILDRLRANAGRAFIESLITRRICAAGRIAIEDADQLRATLDTDRPLIFVSVHTSNLGDLLGAMLIRLTSHKGVTTTRPFANRFRQRLVDKIRRHPEVQILHPGVSAARQLLRHLSLPRHSALLHLDEARDRQVHFPTLDRRVPKSTNLMLAIRLAEHTGALLVPVHLQRNEGAFFSLRCAAPIAPEDVSLPGACKSHERRMAIAGLLDNHFEEVIRQRIDDWLQIYYLRM
jgi:lauroyl/myristoyl acyltransferase